MRWYTIKEAADLLGMTRSALRVWELRYRYPQSARQDNGYRLYSDATIAELHAFIAAGKPFHELEAGMWLRPLPPPKPVARPNFAETYAALESRWLTALADRDTGVIASYLASLGRMRPALRAEYIDCIRAADLELGGIYRGLMRTYRIEEGATA